MHIINFDGTAITLWENAHYNTIGGDPEVGAGPLGQGNLITGNRDGIIIQKGGSHHTIAGNQIGVEFNGFIGNTYSGIQINDHSSGNVIGPGNVIAYSGAPSIDISTGNTKGTTITRNLIYGEDTVLRMVPPTANYTPAPVILSYDPAGTVSGIACPGCEVEIFSGEDRWAEFYEGSVTAGSDGSFTFNAGAPFSGSKPEGHSDLLQRIHQPVLPANTWGKWGPHHAGWEYISCRNPYFSLIKRYSGRQSNGYAWILPILLVI